MRVFIALARHGSFSAAGRKLGLDATTVSRRARRLESNLQSMLFFSNGGSLQLTAAGRRLSEAGIAVEMAMEMAEEDRVPGAAAGTVRMSCPDGLGGYILAPNLPSFINQRKGLRVEFVATPGYLSATTREVDIAITSSPPEPRKLRVDALSDYEIGLYASESYLGRCGVPQTAAELRGHECIGYVDDLIYTPELRFLDRFETGLKLHLACSSLRIQLVLAANGGGIGAFPCFMADDSRDLVRILPERTSTRTFWIAVHEDLYETARMRAVISWLYRLVEQKREILVPSQYR
ncbi:LysR family transcriptional regulator [Novosphingobium sp. PP1Y]|uniref:LysR family transcriptional regulator n=1 Tax=Novosphingobium sp. PP1Y TaxID=702113 RepID=UPI0035102F6F